MVISSFTCPVIGWVEWGGGGGWMPSYTYHDKRLLSLSIVTSVLAAVTLPSSPAIWRSPCLSSSASAWCRVSSPWCSTRPPEPWCRRRHQRWQLPASCTCPLCRQLRRRKSDRATQFMVGSMVAIITFDGAERELDGKHENLLQENSELYEARKLQHKNLKYFCCFTVK